MEGLHFDPKLVTRGLIVDKMLGNLLKARTHLCMPLVTRGLIVDKMLCNPLRARTHLCMPLVTRGLIVDETLGNLLKARTQLCMLLQEENTFHRPYQSPLWCTSMTQHGTPALQQLCQLTQGVRNPPRLAARMPPLAPGSAPQSGLCPRSQARHDNAMRLRGIRTWVCNAPGGPLRVRQARAARHAHAELGGLCLGRKHEHNKAAWQRGTRIRVCDAPGGPLRVRQARAARHAHAELGGAAGDVRARAGQAGERGPLHLPQHALLRVGGGHVHAGAPACAAARLSA